MTDDLTNLKRRDSHSIREMYLPHSPKKWKGQNGPWKISFFQVEKSSFISVFLQSSWFKLFYGSPGISDIVTYCLVGSCWMKIQNKVTVLHVWVQTNSKKTCPTVSPAVKDLPKSKIVTVTQNLIISKKAFMGNWWQLMSQPYRGCHRFCVHLTASWWQLSQPYI